MKLKVCLECNESKALTEFYKDSRMSDGYLNQCKQCKKSYVGKYRKHNAEKVRLYDRKRSNTQKRRASKNRTSALIRNKRPENVKANNAVNNAVRDGRLIKPDCCSVCGAVGSVHGHHNSYDKDQRLVVEWLCRSCHKAVHYGDSE